MVVGSVECYRAKRIRPRVLLVFGQIEKDHDSDCPWRHIVAAGYYLLFAFNRSYDDQNLGEKELHANHQFQAVVAASVFVLPVLRQLHNILCLPRDLATYP